MALAQPMRAPDSILDRLSALHPKKIDLSLARMERLMAALGHPERRLPPAIHVAGTNGKGSTIAFMRAILEAAGKRVHVYTSPHLVRFNERIRLAGHLVEDAPLAEALERAETANAGAPITLFEITTAAALILFSETPADVLLLEVGLGGRLDATNVIETPAVSVITPVSIDHVDFLGSTLSAIAGEKAGIIKPRVPVVSGAQAGEAEAVIERAAARARAPVFMCGQHWSIADDAGRLAYADENGLLDLPRPRLVGPHQIGNAGIAVAALRAMPGLALPAAAFEAGILKADWPARLQRLGSGPLVARAPAGAEVWLDGGHNAAGGEALAHAVCELEERYSRPLVLVVGMLGTKDVSGFLAPFAGLARAAVAVPVPGDHMGLSPQEVAATAQALGIPASVAADVGAALDGLSFHPQFPPPRVLVAGSLYLAGAVLAQNGMVPD
ncbi:bifunctional folylpolyglutamate synthase/dihydrofolate synthase [Xanthobacter tagetidis]|uniref:Dihydrofolate synthase/folylpolyglutamate synthase n=1 Tax=Xanthobacter tagetidis TaxID=60216 RepID=A0A3L7AHV4_9HYPH|nr:folylpolyglutamate synthase/dihydrofolate synthase family protein [Xanthobacter tagetidis]MBB6306851.1 dihydrofolate synthase/folylpolyglutamate synthase [Xanthobacter tagetidis]RLP80076.1 bifunctional folylpolyglutamate synthase/dihydrofolate synthase [Xanthobacter tagetidis]